MEVEKSVLCKGLQFALPPKNLEYPDYMVSFELLFRDINTTNLSNIQNETIKSKLRDIAFFLLLTHLIKINLKII